MIVQCKTRRTDTPPCYPDSCFSLPIKDMAYRLDNREVEADALDAAEECSVLEFYS